jgi:hypothetical protein
MDGRNYSLILRGLWRGKAAFDLSWEGDEGSKFGCPLGKKGIQ